MLTVEEWIAMRSSVATNTEREHGLLRKAIAIGAVEMPSDASGEFGDLEIGTICVCGNRKLLRAMTADDGLGGVAVLLRDGETWRSVPVHFAGKDGVELFLFCDASSRDLRLSVDGEVFGVSVIDCEAFEATTRLPACTVTFSE